jgi:hypothetical protein
MAARVRPDTGEATPVQRHWLTNWSAYDCSLLRRGSPTIWFGDVSIKHNCTPAPPFGRGKPGLVLEDGHPDPSDDQGVRGRKGGVN